MTVIPSGVPRASIIRRAVAFKVVRSAPPPVTAPACAVEIAFKNHAVQSASPVIIPNNHYRDRNAPNSAAAEMGRTCPGAVAAVPSDG
jgi:hypothetical protein